jgi:hypothetical protein
MFRSKWRLWWVALVVVGFGGVVAALQAFADEPTGSKEEKKGTKVAVDAPGASVRADEEGSVDVAAPGVRVLRTDRGLRVIAPFVDLVIPYQEEEKQGQGAQKDKPRPEKQGKQAPGKDEPSKSKKEKIVAERRPYLGVAVDRVPESLAAQFSDLLAEGRGALVTEVQPDSPAAKAGLKRFDVILALDQETIESPEDLVKSVLALAPGKKTTLRVLRQGKVVETEVTLGERVVPLRQLPYAGLPKEAEEAFGKLRRLERRGGPPFATGQPFPSRAYRRFLEVSIRSLGDDRIELKVRWDHDGTRRELALEGTREEVRKNVQEHKDLPEDVRQMILESLETKPRGGWRFRITPFWYRFDEDDDQSGFFFWGPLFWLEEDGGVRLWLNPGAPAPEEILERLPRDLPPEVREEIERSLRRFAAPVQRPDQPDRQQETKGDQQPSPDASQVL